MKVRVTKVMAKEISKAMKARDMEFDECIVGSMSERGYILNVAGTDGAFEAQDNGDYDWETGEYKFIKIVWPWHYHACPTYLTTQSLRATFKRCGGNTLEQFMDTFYNEIAI